MAYSYKQVEGDGSTTVFSTPDYLDKDNIKVAIDNVDTSFEWLTNSTIKLSSAPASGKIVKVYRVTPLERVVNFVNENILTEGVLDYDSNQLIYVMQELTEWAKTALVNDNSGNLDALERRIINVATPTEDTDAANKAYVDQGAVDEAEGYAKDAATSLAGCQASKESCTTLEASCTTSRGTCTTSATSCTASKASCTTLEASCQSIVDTAAATLLNDLKTNDGAGSGLDADKVDGLHATELMGLTNAALGSASDPNTTPAGYILSNHANTPYYGAHWLIHTVVDHTVGKKCQMAFRVGDVVRVLYRQYTGSSWTAWERLNNDGYAIATSISATGTVTITGCTIGRPLVIVASATANADAHASFRVVSGSHGGYSPSRHFCLAADSSRSAATAPSCTLIPIATSVVLEVATLVYMNLHAYT